MTRDGVRNRVLGMIDERTGRGHQSGWTLGGRNLDSLDIIELNMQVEDEWGIEISDELWNHDTAIEQVVLDVQNLVCGPIAGSSAAERP